MFSRCLLKIKIPQYSEWTVRPLSSATCSPVFAVYWLPLASSALLLDRKCSWLAERMLITCVMRRAWTHILQMSGPTVHSYTVIILWLLICSLRMIPGLEILVSNVVKNQIWFSQIENKTCCVKTHIFQPCLPCKTNDEINNIIVIILYYLFHCHIEYKNISIAQKIPSSF